MLLLNIKIYKPTLKCEIFKAETILAKKKDEEVLGEEEQYAIMKTIINTNSKHFSFSPCTCFLLKKITEWLVRNPSMDKIMNTAL